MFSFRTTPLEDQMDKALLEGRVGCFCTQNCWNPDKGSYMYELFRERGNLAEIFAPEDAELTPGTNHISFSLDAVKEGRVLSYEQVAFMHRDPITLNAQLDIFLEFFRGFEEKE